MHNQFTAMESAVHATLTGGEGAPNTVGDAEVKDPPMLPPIGPLTTPSQSPPPLPLSPLLPPLPPSLPRCTSHSDSEVRFHVARSQLPREEQHSGPAQLNYCHV